MTHSLGMLIESLVAVLLVLTIVYCVVLNRRLKGLRSGEQSLRETIAELVAASERAERAIAGLKLTVQESDQTLGERLRAAERMSEELTQQVAAGERRAYVAPAAPRAHEREADSPPDALAVMAAASAFAERAQSRIRGRAA